MKKKFSIDQIKKYLKKYSITHKKKQYEKEEYNIGVISRTLFSSLIIVSFFFVTPFVINFKKERYAHLKIMKIIQKIN